MGKNKKEHSFVPMNEAWPGCQDRSATTLLCNTNNGFAGVRLSAQELPQPRHQTCRTDPVSGNPGLVITLASTPF